MKAAASGAGPDAKEALVKCVGNGQQSQGTALLRGAPTLDQSFPNSEVLWSREFAAKSRSLGETPKDAKPNGNTGLPFQPGIYFPSISLGKLGILAGLRSLVNA